MLETSESPENSGAAGGGGTACNAAVNLENGEGSGGGGELGGEEVERHLTGNRWPREETLALLKIRCDLDVAFRSATIKAPLWEEVSRKLGELGFHRSAKKCREKFENISKYHKRTKDGRSGRQNGKSYRFFEQLELLDNNQLSALEDKMQSFMPEATMATPVTAVAVTTKTIPTSICSIPNSNTELVCTSPSTTSSSHGTAVKKRKLGDYLEALMKEVLDKQEKLQNTFIEAMEKCEKDRVAREEAWKTEELARMKREQEMLAQGRAIAAAKDAALIALLQKITEQDSPVQFPENPIPSPTPIPSAERVPNQSQEVDNGGGESRLLVGSSRWPRVEVEALISLRTNLEMDYHDSGPKGPLWEEISCGMRKLGYDRSAKRCKEKWENINKYFKRVRESPKKRPVDSKTCTYFHMLESLYERKSNKVANSDQSGHGMKPEDILLQMMGHRPQQLPESVAEDGESENLNDQNQENDGNGDGDGDGDDDEDDDTGDEYQIVANNPSPVTAME